MSVGGSVRDRDSPHPGLLRSLSLATRAARATRGGNARAEAAANTESSPRKRGPLIIWPNGGSRFRGNDLVGGVGWYLSTGSRHHDLFGSVMAGLDPATQRNAPLCRLRVWLVPGSSPGMTERKDWGRRSGGIGDDGGEIAWGTPGCRCR